MIDNNYYYNYDNNYNKIFTIAGMHILLLLLHDLHDPPTIYSTFFPGIGQAIATNEANKRSSSNFFFLFS